MKDIIKKPEEEKVPQAPKSPGYQSQWGSQINDIMDRIQNREKFNYDFNADALYNQYKDRFVQQGQLAMKDTMGQAAALTGGYGNSYAQSVGQQAYQGYMQGLNDKIPELYQLALDKYNREGNAMMEQYGLLTDRDNVDYGRWQNAAALAQSQINAMIEKGIMPSDELINQSGLSREYIDAIMRKKEAHYEGDGSGGSSGGGRVGGGASDGKWRNPTLTETLGMISNSGVNNDQKRQDISKTVNEAVKNGEIDIIQGNKYKQQYYYKKNK